MRMELLDIILWIIYPYSVIPIVLMGLIWQYDFEYIKQYSTESGIQTLSIVKWMIRFLLIIVTMTGISLVFVDQLNGDRLLLVQWLIGLMTLSPSIDLILHSSIVTKIHIFTFFTLLFILPFTTYIRFITKPIRYIFNKQNEKSTFYPVLISSDRPTSSLANRL